MLKGGLLFSIVLLLTYLIVTGLEYFGRFGSGMRLFLLITFCLTNGYLLIRFLIIPLLKLNKLGKHLTLIDAAEMLGKVFPEVGDKLKNTLQLKNDSHALQQNLELVNASIEQRSENLSIVPFSSAVDLKENLKYLKYLIPIVLVFLMVGFLNPNWFYGGTERVLNFGTEYVEPAPFKFVLESDKEAVQGENYTLKIKLVGDEIPDEVSIYSNKGNYNLKQSSKISFEHEFANLDDELEFYCVANNFESENFEVKLLQKPVIEDIKLMVNYPQHTGIQPTSFENTGDIDIPEGAHIKWQIGTKNLSKLQVNFEDSVLSLKNTLSGQFEFSKRFFESSRYLLKLSSNDIQDADSVTYAINVIKDKYPTIDVSEEIDSTNKMKRFIQGKITDDYGFTGLVARLNITRKDSSYTINQPINFSRTGGTQIFSFYLDISNYKLKAGDKLDYYFIVRDNDKINNYKSASSNRLKFNIPEFDQLENELGQQDEQIKSEIDKAAKEAKDLRKEIKETKQDILNKPNLDWKDKQQLENLINKKADLNKELEELKKKFDESIQEKEDLLDNSEELQKKQEELQKLMEEMMDEELMKLFEELEELLEEMNKDQLIDNLEEMEMNSESLEEELDRALELFKNLELDQKLENLEEQLRELAEQEESLKEQSENKELSNEELSQKQEELNKKFEEIQEDINEIEEKNQDLNKPRDMEFNEEMENGIKEEMSESKENLDKNKRNKSEENQSKAAEMMKQMADDAQAMQSAGAQQQKMEDMEALRFLLENLVTLSHDQEEIMNQYEITDKNDPYYLSLNRDQLAVSKATEIVKDSLVALSKRVFELSEKINKELNNLSYNLDKSLVYSEDRNTNSLLNHQQYSMTSYNNLALLLSEVLDQMQQAMKNPMPGNGSCDNPGGSGSGKSGSKPSMQGLKEQLQQQISKMKGGQQPGGEEGKGKEGMGKGQMPGMGGIPQLGAQQRAKMAAEQGKLREGLKQLRQELNKDGSGAGNGLNDVIEELEKLQDELLNGKIGSDYIKRQEDIYTRLLESEKALRERGFSDEREAKEGKNDEDSNLKEFTEYNKKKDAEVEFIRSLPVGLRVYYKSLVNDYFNAVNSK